MSDPDEPRLADIRAGYDKLAVEKGDDFTLGPAFYRQCLAMGGSLRGRVLDVGCGAGFMLLALGARWPEARLFGGDISREMLFLARRKVSRAGLVQFDALHLPFADEAFDAGFMTEVLEHLLDHRSALEETRRVLKPGAPFVLTVPNADWVLYSSVKNQRKRFQPVDDHFFAFQEIAGLLAGAGFDVRRVQGSEMLYYHKGWRLARDRVFTALWPPLRRRMKRLVFACTRA